MANQGATVSQIGDMLAGSQGTSSIAGSSNASTIANLSRGGKTISGYTATGMPTYDSTRSTTAPDVISNIVGSTSGNVVGSGFSSVTNALRDDDFSGLMSARSDATGVQGYDNASKMNDAGMSYGPMGFGPPELDPFGGRGQDVSTLTDIDNTGFDRDAESAGLVGGLFGGSVVESDKKGLDVAEIAKGYGRDFGLNFGSFMNTPNMAGVTPTMAMSKGTFAPYSDFGTKLGGQAPTYGVTLADYNFNKDGTVTGRFSGQNQGFFASPLAGAFAPFMPTAIAPAFQAARVAGGLIDSSRKGTFSTVSNMLGLISPTAALITTPVNYIAQAKGIDVDAMLGLGANQGYMSQVSPTDMSSDDNTQSQVNVSKAPVTEKPTQEIRLPDTAPTDLIKRRKRKAGEDIYGVSSSSPFLNYSDDIDISGIGSFTGSARSGQFKQAPTGR